MSPIDDELRAALRGRADTVTPAPDPLGGIEARARSMKRRRAGATIAAAAIAVAAIAVAVPTLTGSDKADDPSRLATTAPTTAPTTATATASPSPAAVVQDPANVVSWMSRGDSSLVDEEAVRAAYAHAMAVEPELESVHYKPLYTGDTDSGVRFTIGQAWFSGDTKAHTFGYATGGTNGPQVFLGPETPQATDLVALLVDSLPGTTTDLLVLVPRPGTGQLSYDTDAIGKFTPVANGRSDLDGVGLVDRSTTATNDRVEQLDGDGNMDKPIYRGPIAPFLCADKECG